MSLRSRSLSLIIVRQSTSESQDVCSAVTRLLRRRYTTRQSQRYKMLVVTLGLLLLFDICLSGEAVQLVLKPEESSILRPIGKSAIFTCEIIGDEEVSGSYKVQWYDPRGNEIIDTTGRRYVEGEGRTKKLYFFPFESSDAGSYQCSSIINGETKTQSIRLNLFNEIKFEHAPKEQYPKIYTDALIECRVTGEPGLVVSWRYNGQRIRQDERYSLMPNGLLIKNVTTKDNGNYSCQAEEESAARFDERRISVNVHIPPKMIQGPNEIEGVVGVKLKLNCKATGVPPPKFEFIKDAETKPLQTIASVLTVNSDEGTIEFHRLRKEDDGIYICKAVNDVGEAQASGRVSVLVPPHIFELNHGVGSEGSDAVLTCRASGDPEPILSFRNDSSDLKYTVGEYGYNSRIVVSTPDPQSIELRIRMLRLSDAGDYSCMADSTAGKAVNTTSLTVQYAPKFVANQSQIYHTWVGRTSRIQCQVDGIPRPEIVWSKDGKLIANSKTYAILGGENSSALEINSDFANQDIIYGTYVCKATNKIDSREMEIQLFKATVPDSPKFVDVNHVTATVIRLGILAPENNGGMPVLGYTIKYMTERTPDSDNMSYDTTAGVLIVNASTSDEEEVKLKNLRPSTKYSITVQAENEVGLGPITNISQKTDAPSAPDMIIITSDSKSSSATEYTVEWAEPENNGFDILQYNFTYRKIGTKGKESQSAWKEIIRDDDNLRRPILQFTLTGLSANSTYVLQVQARNRLGWSTPEAQIQFTTAKEAEMDTLKAMLDSGIFLGIIAAIIVVILLVIIDLSCFCTRKCGVTMAICVHCCGRSRPTSSEKEMEEGEKTFLKNSLPDDRDDDSKEDLKEQVKVEEQNGSANEKTEETSALTAEIKDDGTTNSKTATA